MAGAADITQWLDAAREGDGAALNQMLSTLYQELRSMARRQFSGRYGQTLDATALVHEAYLKLVGSSSAHFEDRTHFLAYAASVMRSVMVDYARQRMARKRGGGPAPDHRPARGPARQRRARAVAGDLDNIVLKALSKRCDQRYASVEAMALDLQRYLDERPVLARPQRLGYRMGKFVQRHRWPLSTAFHGGGAGRRPGAGGPAVASTAAESETPADQPSGRSGCSGAIRPSPRATFLNSARLTET